MLLAVATLATAHTPWRTVDATSYSACSSGTITASGQRVHFGGVAMNNVPLGTRIEVSPAVFGKRYFVVNDRIGSGSQLDVFAPNCGAAVDFGRRVLRYRVV